MKHNTLKKVLSLLLVICMMASFAGCTPGEEDPTEPSSIETTGTTENTTSPTDGATVPTDSPDETTSPTEETHAPTDPTETETEPPATEASNTEPTFATEIPTESPVETFVDVVETVYAISTVNVRSGPSTDDMIVGSLSYGESVQRTGIGNKGWSRVEYNGEEAYVYASYLSTTNPAQDTSGYPKTYSDTGLPTPLRMYPLPFTKPRERATSPLKCGRGSSTKHSRARPSPQCTWTRIFWKPMAPHLSCRCESRDRE